MPQSLPRPEDPVTRRRAAIASGDIHQVLAAAGAWLREADETHRDEAIEALETTTAAEAMSALAAIDSGAASEALLRAFDEAFEAAFEEDEEERETLEAAAIASLTVRDDVESTLAAVDLVCQTAVDAASAGAQLASAARSLREELAAIDAAARPRTRSLSAVNPARRARAATLGDAHRDAAWWWTDRAAEAHDGLVEGLAGLEVAAGESALADLDRARLAPRGDALGAALRATESAADEDPAMRWVRAEAQRSEPTAIALGLVRDLRVESLVEGE